MRKLIYYGLAVFYILAGANHFVDPEFYFGLVPDYIGFERIIVLLSGIAEIGLGVLVLFPRYRMMASRLIVLMLLAFIPSHIWFIEIGSCLEGGLCVDEWISWVRLLVIHPILMYWAYWVGFKYEP